MASVGFGGPGILVLGVAGVGGGVCDTLSGDYGGAHAEGHCEPANPTDIARSTHCFLLYRRLATRQTLRPSPQREGANSAINFLRRQFRARDRTPPNAPIAFRLGSPNRRKRFRQAVERLIRCCARSRMLSRM